MLNRELIEVQKGCPATCVVLLKEDSEELENAYRIKASLSDADLFACPLGKPFFKEELEAISKKEEIAYFIIDGIDEVSIEEQNRYVGLVKDREFMGYELPEKVIIGVTVSDTEGVKKIASELYSFCVVTF